MKRQLGFTLIEMLVAMAIFASLISVLMFGFSQGLMLWDKGQQQSRVWQDQEFRYRLLDTMVTQAVISDEETKIQGLSLAYFQGTETSMRFISSAPIMDVPGRVRPVELRAKQSEAGVWQLSYREGARYSDVGRGIRWGVEWVTLLKGLKSVSFSFEAPAFPVPEGLDARFLTADEKLLYRDAPVWVNDYNISKLWRYPQKVAINFVDHNEVSHRWLFIPPRWPDAWSMVVYEDL